MIALLWTFLFIIIICCFTVIKETIQDIKKDKENSINKRNIDKKPIIISSIIGILVIIVLFISFYNEVSTPNTKSEWEKLSDEEKEWYENNYGDGKLEDIDKAIDEYKENH